MARQIVNWCDRHLHLQDQHVPAEEIRVGIDQQWWSADLCSGCIQEMVGPLATLLAAHGQKSNVPAPRTSPGAVRAKDGLLEADVLPTTQDNQRIQQILQERRAGIRYGRHPTPGSDRQLPCIFCGLELMEGGNAVHLRLHGFSNLSRALGNICPWCGAVTGSLGGHLTRSHMDKITRTPIQIVRALLEAHVHKAPYDQLHAIRERGYNVEPLGPILQGFTRA